MPVTNYLTVKGEIIGEATGGVRTDYLTDALGSVTATVDQSASVVNTYRYKPYGELLAKTGSGSDPQFGWVGSAGYAGTGRKYAEVYVRARHYSSANARWTSKDPIGQGGSDLNYYRYVENRPVGRTDPSGLVFSIKGCSSGEGDAIKLACACLAKLGKKEWSDVNDWIKAFNNGIKNRGMTYPPCKPIQNTKCMQGFCKCGTINCKSESCNECRVKKESVCGATTGEEQVGGCGSITICTPGNQSNSCKPLLFGISDDMYGLGWASPTAMIVYHEIGHVCGYNHNGEASITKPDDPRANLDRGTYTCNNLLSNAIRNVCEGLTVAKLLKLNPVYGQIFGIK